MFWDILIAIYPNVYLFDPASYYQTWCYPVLWMHNKFALRGVGMSGRVSILLLRYTKKVLHPSLVLCLGPSYIFVRIPHDPLNNRILGIKGQWSLCSIVSFTSGLLQRVQPGFGNSFYLYLMSFSPHNPDTFFTTQIWKRWGTLSVTC